MTATQKKKLLFYCQHVLGMGHFIRGAEIVRGLKDFEVYFLNGGEIVPGFELPVTVEVINLPPIKADAEFRDIYAADESANLDQIKAARREQILAEFNRIKPDILMIELFPFGRLKFAFELIPLLDRVEASGRSAKVVCSLRDILVSKREQRQFEEDACRIVNHYFNLLLVHSDPKFQRLDETFPKAAEITCPIRYTGFVTQKSCGIEDVAADASGGKKEILISIGGGRVGVELIDCAIDAGELIASKFSHRMSIFTGPYLPDAEFARLEARIGKLPEVEMRRYTTEFIARLRWADLSVSMAGYNTCMNLIATGARAIVYPFTGNNNQEQTIRAEKLQRLGIVDVISGRELAPQVLAAKIIEALSNPKPMANQPVLDLDGVEKTAAALAELVNEDKR